MDRDLRSLPPHWRHRVAGLRSAQRPTSSTQSALSGRQCLAECPLCARSGHPGHVKNSFLLCRSSDSSFCDRHVEYPLGDLHDCKIRQRRAVQEFQHLLKFPQARKDYCERRITTNHGFRTTTGLNSVCIERPGDIGKLFGLLRWSATTSSLSARAA